jgi:hypothetical protein
MCCHSFISIWLKARSYVGSINSDTCCYGCGLQNYKLVARQVLKFRDLLHLSLNPILNPNDRV